MQLIAVFFGLLLGGLLTACGDRTAIEAQAHDPFGKQPACGEGAYLETEIYGGIRTRLQWADHLACDGMPRPNGRGARLRFAGLTADEQPLALILGLPDLQRGTTAREIPTNVTLIAEDQGRFFSTPDTKHCWTDILKQEKIGNEGDRYQIRGVLYCVAALAEVNGSSSITLGDLSFAGILNWKINE